MIYNKFLHSLFLIVVSNLLCTQPAHSMNRRLDGPLVSETSAFVRRGAGATPAPKKEPKKETKDPLISESVPATQTPRSGSDQDLEQKQERTVFSAGQEPKKSSALDFFIVAREQLLRTIFIFMQAPWTLEERVFSLCSAGNNVFLDQYINLDIVHEERFLCGLDDLDKETQQEKYYQEIKRQNFNPCLFRLIQEYENVTKIIDAALKHGKLSARSRDVARSLDVVSASFLIYIDDNTQHFARQTKIDFDRLQKYAQEYRMLSLARVRTEILDFLVETNNKIIAYFLDTLHFKKPHMRFIFFDGPIQAQDFKKLCVSDENRRLHELCEKTVIASDVAAQFHRLSMLWIAVQRMKMATLSRFSLSDLYLLPLIEKNGFLCYRRLELFSRACKDCAVRAVLIQDLQKLFACGDPRVTAVTETFGSLSIA